MAKYTIQNPSGGAPIVINAEGKLSDEDIDQIIADKIAATPKAPSVAETTQKEAEAGLLGGTGAPMSPEEALQKSRERFVQRAAMEGQPNIQMMNGKVVDVNQLSPLGQALLSIPRSASAGQTFGGTNVLEKGLQNLLLKTGLTTPEVVKALGVESQMNQESPEDVLASTIGGMVTGGGSAKSVGAAPSLAKKLISGTSTGAQAGALSELNREVAQGEEIDPNKIEQSAKIGGAIGLAGGGIGAAGQKLSERLRSALSGEKPVIENPVIAEPTPLPVQTAEDVARRESPTGILAPVQRAYERGKINISEAQQANREINNLADTAFSKIDQENKASKEALGTLAEENAPQSILNAGAVKTSVKEAAKNGILPTDIQLYVNATPQERGVLSSMVKNAKAYLKNPNDRSLDPALKVGDEFLTRIKSLEEIKDNIGQELGNYVKDLNAKEVGNPAEAVVERLNEVPGLSGLRLVQKVVKGKKMAPELDFSHTTLSGSLTASERKELQSVFNDLKNRSPLQLHKYRQELFEVLGGKKKANIQLTDTLDKGLEAVRQGIADVLENANPQYRELNQRYAQAVSPLREIYKVFRAKNGTPEDILSMKGAIAGRRLTSNAPSGADLEGILNNIEEQIVSNGGKIDTNIGTIQKFYNSLTRYYPEIIRETSLQGQAQHPEYLTESLRGAVMKKAKQLGSITPAVRRKYLEDLVDALSSPVD